MLPAAQVLSKVKKKVKESAFRVLILLSAHTLLFFTLTFSHPHEQIDGPSPHHLHLCPSWRTKKVVAQEEDGMPQPLPSFYVCGRGGKGKGGER